MKDVDSIMKILEQKAQKTKKEKPFIEKVIHTLPGYEDIDIEDVSLNNMYLNGHYNILAPDPAQTPFQKGARLKEKIFFLFSRPFLDRQVAFNARVVRYSNGMLKKMQNLIDTKEEPIRLSNQGLPHFSHTKADILLTQNLIIEHHDKVERGSLDQLLSRINKKTNTIVLSYVLEQFSRKKSLSFLQQIRTKMSENAQIIIYAKHAKRMENIQESRASEVWLFTPESLKDLGDIAGLEMKEILYSDDSISFSKTGDANIDANFRLLESIVAVPNYFAITFVRGK